MSRVAITGAWSYSGEAVATALVAAGHEVLSLTSRMPPDPDPHGGKVRRVPFGQFSVAKLTRALEGVEAVHCGYWVRHNLPPVGHRGPWTSHAQAVRRSARLIEAAGRASVQRLVWTSIANPGLDPDLSYYSGKAEVERLVRESGISYAILRPTCFFGRGAADILIQNVAWAARYMPWIPIPAGPPYWIRPIHVDDYATLVVSALASSEIQTRDVTGPDRIEFGELVRLISEVTGGRGRALRLPLPVCRALFAVASQVCRETILTADELRGLSRNRLDSSESPLGTISLTTWLRDNAPEIGQRFAREPKR